MACLFGYGWLFIPVLLASQITGPGLQSYVAEKREAAVIIALGDKSARESTAALEERTRRVIAALGRDEFRASFRWDAIGAFGGIVTAQGLQKLLANPDVARVELETGGFVVRAERLPVRRYERIAVLDAGLDAADAEVKESVDAEACFCRHADGAGCCPDGAGEQTGDGSATDEIGHSGLAKVVHTQNRGGLPKQIVGANTRVVAVKVMDRHGRLPSMGSLLAALNWLATSERAVSMVVFGFESRELYCAPCDSLSAAGIALNRAIILLRGAGAKVLGPAAADEAGSGLPGCLPGVERFAVRGTDDARQGAQGSARLPLPGAPPPSPAPQYSARVTALALRQTFWPEGSFRDDRVLSGNAVYTSVEIQVQTWRPDMLEVPEMLWPGRRLEVFIEGELKEILTGRQLRARLRIAGDTRGVRWLVQDVRLSRCEAEK